MATAKEQQALNNALKETVRVNDLAKESLEKQSGFAEKLSSKYADISFQLETQIKKLLI